MVWGIWCVDHWATGEDASGDYDALFLLWSLKKEAEASLSVIGGKFPAGSVVECISAEKWLSRYTGELVNGNAAAFLCFDDAMRGVAVRAEDFRRDIESTLEPSGLQSADLSRLRRNSVRRARRK
jgi:hypothetical protein